MATNYVQPGVILTTANATGSTVASGGVLVVGGTIRVAINDIANGASGPAATEGVHSIPATHAEAWIDGLPLYWDQATSHLTATSTNNILAGVAAGAKVAGAEVASIKLHPGGSSTAATTA